MFWFLAKLFFWLLLTGLIFFILGWWFRQRRAYATTERLTTDLMDEQQKHREAKLKLKEVEGREGDYKTEIARRKNQHAETESTLMKTRQERDEARKKAGGKGDDRELVAMKKELDKCRAARTDLEGKLKAATKSGSGSADLAKITAERDQLALNLKKAKDAAAAAGSGSANLAKITAERDQLAINLKKAKDAASTASSGDAGKSASLNADLAKAKAANEALDAELKKIKASTATREGAKNEEVAMLKNNLVTANQKIVELQKTKPADPAAEKAAKEAADEAAADLAQMKRALDKSRDRVAELEKEADNNKGQLGLGLGGTAAGVMAGAAGAKAASGDAELVAERDQLKAQLDTLKSSLETGAEYASGAKQADDLTDISGVGPGLSTKLNSFGIYTYRQIADWEKGSIDAFDDLLAFPGRIERDNWQKQARQLHLEKYGPS